MPLCKQLFGAISLIHELGGSALRIETRCNGHRKMQPSAFLFSAQRALTRRGAACLFVYIFSPSFCDCMLLGFCLRSVSLLLFSHFLLWSLAGSTMGHYWCFCFCETKFTSLTLTFIYKRKAISIKHRAKRELRRKKCSPTKGSEAFICLYVSVFMLFVSSAFFLPPDCFLCQALLLPAPFYIPSPFLFPIFRSILIPSPCIFFVCVPACGVIMGREFLWLPYCDRHATWNLSGSPTLPYIKSGWCQCGIKRP